MEGDRRLLVLLGIAQPNREASFQSHLFQKRGTMKPIEMHQKKGKGKAVLCRPGGSIGTAPLTPCTIPI